MRKGEPPTVSYARVESALAEILEVRPNRLGAFRGRLQHLRKLGVPGVPRTGSGRKIEYSLADAFEMLVAMRFERLNCSPVVAAMGARIARELLANARRRPNTFLLYAPSEGDDAPSTQNFAPTEDVSWYVQRSDEWMVVNLSRSLLALEAALRE